MCNAANARHRGAADFWASAGLRTAGSVGPSFSCGSTVAAAERAICADLELAAYDRAVAFAYGRNWRPSSADVPTQSGLAKRNACSGDRACILDVYHNWIHGLIAARPLDSLERIAKADNHGADLLLANVRLFGKHLAPQGSVRVVGDDARLFIHALGGDRYVFQIDAAHFYDPHDGRGPKASASYAAGVAHLPYGKGVWMTDTEESPSCSIKFPRLGSSVWQIVELRNGCSGLGSTLSGTYRRR